MSLDPSSQHSVTTPLNAYHHEHGTTVVFVTHEITPVAGFVDRVLYVAGGRWAAGTPDAVMTTQTLSALYGYAHRRHPGPRPHRRRRRR